MSTEYELLSQRGMTPESYAMLQGALAMIDRINDELAAKGSTLRWNVLQSSAPRTEPGPCYGPDGSGDGMSCWTDSLGPGSSKHFALPH